MKTLLVIACLLASGPALAQYAGPPVCENCGAGGGICYGVNCGK